MFKNKKIENYMLKHQRKAGEVKTYLDFFIKNIDEFESILFYSKSCLSEDGLKSYEWLSKYIAEEHKVIWKGERKISPILVRNFCMLARKERDAEKYHLRPVSGRHTVFKVYESDGDTTESR